MTLKNQVEALLFSSGKAMEEEQLASLTENEKRDVRNALKTLQKEYAAHEGALKVFNEGSLWKLLVKDDYISLVRRIIADTELTKATLETLAVVAYNQPKVLQSKVVEMRGGNAYEHVKELLELGFITKQKEGRSFAIRLTEKFYEYFDVEGQDSIRRVFKDAKHPVPKELQQQLGKLQVVDELPVKPNGKITRPGEDKLAGLEVIDEPEQEEAPEEETQPRRLEVTEEEVKENNDFLSKIENQIEQLAGKNDERDSDDDFKPASRDEEETAEGSEEGAREESTEETAEETGTETPETQDSEPEELTDDQESEEPSEDQETPELEEPKTA